jgi:hypothetical protein
MSDIEAVDGLLTVAELAIGLAGFSAVVVTFKRKDGFREAERYLFMTLLTVAFACSLVAFVPFALYHAGLTGPKLWASSSAVYIFIWCVATAFAAAAVMRTPGLVHSNYVGRTSTFMAWLTALVNPLLQVANIIGWPMSSGVFLYVVGLMLWLATAVLLFANLVMAGARD